jgi:predicted permease
MDSILKDLRYALRSLIRYPTFTVLAVLTLALGIGANTAIFTVVNAVLLRPLPYTNAERLMMVGISTPSVKLFNTSKNRFLYWREQSHSFEGLTTFRTFSGPLVNGGVEPDYVTGLRVSEDFFRVFSTYPQIGRTFSNEEEVTGGPKAVVITDALWKRHFGAAPDVLNKSVSINNVNYTIVGVMPETFWFEVDADFITPLQLGTSREISTAGLNYPVVGRLKPGVTRDQALAEMKVIAQQFHDSHPTELLKGEGINVVDYREFMVGEIRLPLVVLLGAVAFVLLIACANVANLQLSRAITRVKEITIRAAMGASRCRVIRQLLTEGLLLSFIGGLAGLLLAVWGVSAFRKLIPEGLIPREDQISISPSVLLFAIAISVFAGIAFGLAPAVQSARLNLTNALKETSTGSRGLGHGRLRGALVVSQVALALVLLIGAALLIRTFANLRSVDPGFDSSRMLTFEFAPRGPKYETTTQVAEFNQRAIDRIRSLPGVEAVATTNTLPLRHWLNLPVEFEGKSDQVISAEWRMISPGYFDAMKMRINEGRNISVSDRDTSAGVAVINESFARRYFPEAPSLGKRLIIGRTMGKDLARDIPLEIVGVVSDSKQTSLKDEALPTIYVPTTQVPDKLMANFRSFYFVIRTNGDPQSFAGEVRREMLSVEGQQPIRNIRTMDEVVATSISAQRFQMSLLALFGGIGLALSGVGIYGVMAYSVSQRTREIGIRMALGAQMKDVLRMVISQGMKLTLLGVVIGLAGSFAVTRLLKTLLFGVQPNDLTTFVIVSLVLVVVALLASYLPARRATKVDPLVALRYE